MGVYVVSQVNVDGREVSDVAVKLDDDNVVVAGLELLVADVVAELDVELDDVVDEVEDFVET